jgi:hypothetical protein
MSNRASNGMMAVVGTHKSLADLESSLMLQGDPNAPNAAAAAPPVTEDVPEIPTVDGKREPIRRKAKAEFATAPVDSLVAEFAPPAQTQMEVLHTRIPVWLNEAIKDKLAPLERANSKVTKQALVTYCLIKALGITPPEDFRLY